MASKIECDRCHTQWPSIDPNEDNERSRMVIDIPLTKSLPPTLPGGPWVERPSVSQVLDLCQNCGREVHEFATTDPNMLHHRKKDSGASGSSHA